MRWALAALAAACAAVVLVLALGAGGASSDTRSYEVELDNAFGLAEGGDFKVAGVRAGETGAVHIEGQGRPLAVVEVEITESGLADLREDARCEVRPQSFIGEYYLDCQPGTGRRLPNGGRVPVAQTSSTIPLDLVNNILRRPYRDRLRLIVAELGAGLAGRPGDLNDAIRRAHPGLRETSETLRILGRQTREIRTLIRDADRVIGALEQRKGDVTAFVREAGRTAELSSTRRTELAATFSELPAFLAELEPYMGRLGDLAEAQQPVLRDLGAASGDLNTFLARLRPFAEAGTPAFEALGEASVVGRRAVRQSDEEIAELRRLAREAPGVAKPLRQFLQTIDDRRRAVEPDSRAPGGRGFTGMEAIWNYFYWQALTTNPLDDLGHVLRLNIVTELACAPYTNEPSPEQLDTCNQFVGPNQPGVTTPDPTEGTQAASSQLLDYVLAP